MADTRRLVTDPLFENNPIILQTLGICSALAVTSSLQTRSIMCIALTSVLAFSNLLDQLIRNHIPGSIRIIVQMVIIASLVIVVDQILKAYAYEISKTAVGLRRPDHHQLHRDGPGRGFAMKNPPWRSFLDGVGNGLGYSAILIGVGGLSASCFGSGKLDGHRDPAERGEGGWYVPNGLMLLPPSAFFIIGSSSGCCARWKTRNRSASTSGS